MASSTQINLGNNTPIPAPKAAVLVSLMKSRRETVAADLLLLFLEVLTFKSPKSFHVPFQYMRTYAGAWYNLKGSVPFR